MPTPPPITAPYLLVTGIPLYVGAAGTRLIDELWLKDLREHFVYLHNLTIAAPLATVLPPSGAKYVPADFPAGVKTVDLPHNQSMLRALLNWPRTFARIWGAIGDAKVVHLGVADWPLPSGWTVTLITRLRRRVTLIVIESAFWRKQGADVSTVGRLKARVWEAMNRWCVDRATIAIFTQQQYRDELMSKPERGHVIPASWIDADNVLPTDAVEQSWNDKLAAPGRLLFAGRLIEEKGVGVLLEAIRLLRERGVTANVDIIGSGHLSAAIEAVAADSSSPTRVNLIAQVPYGRPFFDVVACHDAILIPSVSDEQPRLVYDSFSQGVPVLASATPGIAACVRDGVDGKLIPPRDANTLADLIAWAMTHRSELRTMGRAGRDVAAMYTHREMHARRWKLVDDALQARSF
jgi:glycosyltransferase involved in cell wall biosynthesis